MENNYVMLKMSDIHCNCSFRVVNRKKDKSDHNGDNLTLPAKSDTRKLYTSTIYKSADREAVLELCDYYDPIYNSKNSKNGDGVEDRIQALLDNDETTRAAAYGELYQSMSHNL